VSDYDAWAQIYDTHKYCPDYECAAAAGINAGMDQVSCVNNDVSDQCCVAVVCRRAEAPLRFSAWPMLWLTAR
jgi:hypothetical protein